MSRSRRFGFATTIIWAPLLVSAAPSLGASPSAPPSPVLIADGEPWIAYQWGDGAGGGTVFLVRPDGTGLHELRPGIPGDESHPDWSPDGSRIAYIETSPAGTSELWVVDADGTDAERLVECRAPCIELGYPDWSPDGRSVYYGMSADASGGPPATFGVGRVDVATARDTLTEWAQVGMHPDWTPDGARVRHRDIMVFGDSAEAANLYAMAADGRMRP